jgi:flavin-dependent dehydrogenase
VSFDTDVFILGGGPAGLAAAIAARRAGFSVTLADAKCPPIDKVCGEGLMPDSLAAAARLGIEVPSATGYPLRGIRFTGGPNTVAAEFSEASGLGIRRTVLHQLLVSHAERAGVDLRWNCSVAGIQGEKVRLGQHTLKARWMVGADGTRSSVRRWANLDEFRRESNRFSFRRHYRIAPWSEFVEIHWADGCQVYITPVGPQEVCVVLMSRYPQFRIEDALPLFPQLAARLRVCEPVAAERGAFAATHRLKKVAHGNVALVGDASGTVDPITGKGVCLAFQQAAALADAFRRGDLSSYQKAHAHIMQRPMFMADFMLTMDRWPGLRTRALRAMEAHPQRFATLLAMHVDGLGVGRMAATAAMLGWEVATA